MTSQLAAKPFHALNILRSLVPSIFACPIGVSDTRTAFTLDFKILDNWFDAFDASRIFVNSFSRPFRHSMFCLTYLYPDFHCRKQDPEPGTVD